MNRDRILSVRLTDDEHQRILAEAAADRVTPSEWIRRTIARELATLAEIQQLRNRRVLATGTTVGSTGTVKWGSTS